MGKIFESELQDRVIKLLREDEKYKEQVVETIKRMDTKMEALSYEEAEQYVEESMRKVIIGYVKNGFGLGANTMYFNFSSYPDDDKVLFCSAYYKVMKSSNVAIERMSETGCYPNRQYNNRMQEGNLEDDFYSLLEELMKYQKSQNTQKMSLKGAINETESVIIRKNIMNEIHKGNYREVIALCKADVKDMVSSYMEQDKQKDPLYEFEVFSAVGVLMGIMYVLIFGGYQSPEGYDISEKIINVLMRQENDKNYDKVCHRNGEINITQNIFIDYATAVYCNITAKEIRSHLEILELIRKNTRRDVDEKEHYTWLNKKYQIPQGTEPDSYSLEAFILEDTKESHKDRFIKKLEKAEDVLSILKDVHLLEISGAEIYLKKAAYREIFINKSVFVLTKKVGNLSESDTNNERLTSLKGQVTTTKSIKTIATKLLKGDYDKTDHMSVDLMLLKEVFLRGYFRETKSREEYIQYLQMKITYYEYYMRMLHNVDCKNYCQQWFLECADIFEKIGQELKSV